MPDWRVKFLKSRRQCVISQRRMRLEGESRGLQRRRHERRGPLECLPPVGGKWGKTQIATQL